MASNKFFQNAVVAAATLSVAVLAGCPGTPTTPTPSGSASAKPSAPASGTPSGTPTSPSSPASGSSASATPSAAPTSIPSTPDTSSRATVQGLAFDDTQQRLSDVTITGKVLGAGTFANGSDTLSVSTQVGSYALNGAPTGQTILITASKSGFTTRQKTIVPLANLQGDTNINRVDFGDAVAANDQTFALSDKPEVQTMTPKADSTGVDPTTTFTLTFNEPVNTTDVENGFAVAVANDKYTLSSGSSSITLLKAYDPSTDKFGATTAGNVFTAAAPGDHVTVPTYDQGAFNFAWSNNNQTVTATFRNGFKLPTDKDASNIPQYSVGFKAGQNIRDASGSGTRSNAFFRISPAQIGKNGFRFTVAADTTAPRLIGVTAAKAGFSNQNDAIRLQFSETMVLFPSAANIGTAVIGGAQAVASIPLAANAASALLPANLTYNIDTTGTAAKPTAPLNNKDRAGVALAVATPRLYAPMTNNDTVEFDGGSTTVFNSGDTVWAAVNNTVEDPAGNKIETSNASNVKSGKAI